MLERGRLVYPVPGTLGVIGTIPTDGAQGLPNYLFLTTELDPSNPSTASVVFATNVTVHVDQDVLGTGTFTQDVVSAVTLVPGGGSLVKVPYPQGAAIQLRAVTANGKGWQLYVMLLTRYGGTQRGD